MVQAVAHTLLIEDTSILINTRYSHLQYLLRDANQLVKIILFDQRGAGKSTPLDHFLRALPDRHSVSTIYQKRLYGWKHDMGSCQRRGEASWAPQDRKVARLWWLVGKNACPNAGFSSAWLFHDKGSTLSLAYAQVMLYIPYFAECSLKASQSYPERVKSLVLRQVNRVCIQNEHWRSLLAEFSLCARGILLHLTTAIDSQSTLPSELRFFYQNGTSHIFPEAW